VVQEKKKKTVTEVMQEKAQKVRLEIQTLNLRLELQPNDLTEGPVP
jgi:hypothetical protein